MVVAFAFFALTSPGLAEDALAPVPNAGELQRLEQSLERNPEDPKLLLELGQGYHDAATHNQKDAAAKAERFLRKLLALDPRNATARAFLGSVLTLKARDALLPTTKLSLAKEGFREMDAAVLQSPDELRPRLIRGLNSISVPKLFDRLKFAAEDLEWIHKRPVLTSDYGGRPMRQRVALEYGRVLVRLKNPDNARKVWQVGVELDPGTTTADLLRAELKSSGKP